MLTAEQHKLREHKFTASNAPLLMAGDEAELLRLWREMIGEIEPRDLSTEWPPMLGQYMEGFILDWHERKTGRALTERNQFIQHPFLPYVSCTLDAYRAHDDTVLDAKVCNSWQPLQDIINYYPPQCLVQRACRQSTYCALLVMHGSAEPRELAVTWDANYEKEMWARIASFMLCVETLTPPVPLPKHTPPEQWRSINLENDVPPNWGSEAIERLRQWEISKDQADLNARAADQIKKLIPEDVGKVTWQHVSVRRDRRGYLSIRRD